MSFSYEKIISISKEKYIKKDDTPVKYGTAGFRSKAEDLDFILFRMGLLAALRSRFKKGAAIGLVITASHNPACDNGVKLVDPRGEMLAPDWEGHATLLANAKDEETGQVLSRICKECGIQETSEGGLVFMARDTRTSSPRLQLAASEGVSLMGARARDFGVASTPILHFVVTCHNDGGEYGEPTEEGYFSKISSAFVSLRAGCPSKGGAYSPALVFDGANGVGAIEMAKMVPRLKGTLQVQIFNKGEGELNLRCGADHVKSTQGPPEGVPLPPGARLASVDGDADRVVYGYAPKEGGGGPTFRLLDGDKIATLVAGYLKELIQKAGLTLNLGVVQTAYANGASTAHLAHSVGVGVTCACTGVKHLHAAALAFDVGVYFEANGHGTVVFSTKARDAIKEAVKGGSNPAAATELHNAMSLINETVGDAISDLLLVEAVLAAKGWDADTWDKEYTDLPNRLTKIRVSDRCAITTTNAERTCVLPSGLQPAIDTLCAACPQGRAFVRPSGTEDVVRVYAEAATTEEVEKLSREVGRVVYEMAGGVA